MAGRCPTAPAPPGIGPACATTGAQSASGKAVRITEENRRGVRGAPATENTKTRQENGRIAGR